MNDAENCIRCNQNFQLEHLNVSVDEIPICESCTINLNPKYEQLRRCPIDGREMKKLVIYDLVLIDKCYHCGGIWLDNNELRVIEKVVSASAAVGGYLLGRIVG